MNLTMAIFVCYKWGYINEDELDLTKCRIIFQKSGLFLLDESIKFVSILLQNLSLACRFRLLTFFLIDLYFSRCRGLFVFPHLVFNRSRIREYFRISESYMYHCLSSFLIVTSFVGIDWRARQRKSVSNFEAAVHLCLGRVNSSSCDLLYFLIKIQNCHCYRAIQCVCR